MTKQELIKKLEKYNDDFVVVIGDRELGWTNIGEISLHGCCIYLKEDYTLPFSDE